jgi:hypothetical protein
MHDNGEGSSGYAVSIETQYRIAVDTAPGATWSLAGPLVGLASEIKIGP